MFKQNNYKFNVKLVNGCFAALALLCVTSTSHAQTPEIADANSVQGCRFLEKIEGASGYGKSANWKVIAKHSAISQAEKLGASHIVFEQFDTVGGFNGIVTADAYQCGSIAENSDSNSAEKVASHGDCTADC